MNILDLVLLVPLAYFAWKGFSKGFIITLAMLAGILIGFYAAIHFSEFVADLLRKQFDMKSSNIKPISYLFTFTIVLVLTFLLGQFLTSVVKTTGLGIVNRIAGLLLGVAKGLLIVSALVMVLEKIDPKSYLVTKEQKDESALYKPLASVAPKVFPLLKTYTNKAKEYIMNGDDQNI
ncbi:MAG: CvpA family protein [Bacteroidales bacterium]|nr:CvpA family protein [Bacteroidales bacterium]